jgi:group I intron endonuclease
MKNTIGIYCITNLVNNKKYIGQSWNINERFYNHKCYEKNIILKRSFDKYEIKNFNFEILIKIKEDNYTQRLLDFYETYFVFYHDTMNREKGYNIKFPGSYGKHSKETKEKIKEITIKRLSDPTKNPMYGKKHNKEAKEKMSNKAKERLKIPENNPMYQRKQSEQTKQKIKETHKNKFKREQNPFYKHKHTDNTKNKISIKNKGMKRTKEFIEKDRYNNIGNKNPFYNKKHNMETKRKMSENNKKAIKVFCVDLNKNYLSLSKAALEVYGKESYTYKIKKSIKENKKIDNYSWKLL